MEFEKIENIVEAQFRIVTPMFLGGADQQADEIRPSSVKGMLRFWWRALNWSKFRHASNDDASALKALHDEEARLFGSAANKDGGGQGIFLLSVVPSQPKKLVQGEFPPDWCSAAARYLGYGLQLDRDYIQHNQFTVKLKFRVQPDISIINALKTWGLLGGMGRRSRRGYGSLTLQEMKHDGKTIWTAPASAEAYQAEIEDIFSGCALTTQQPPFSAFSKLARIDILINQGKDALTVLNDFGIAMLRYRSAGKKGKVLNKDSERRFIDDHNWYHRVKKEKGVKKEKDFHPRRVVFGLPHNYDKMVHVTPAIHERRASPLLFHVHQVGTQFVGVSVLLNSVFLGKDIEGNPEKINAGGNLVEQKIEWGVLTDFITGKVGNPPAPDAQQRFPNSRNISI